MSCDVESLFTSIPVSETIAFIIREIYENKVIKPMCKIKSIFLCLLEKLPENCVFRINNKLVKQIMRYLMGGAISVTMSYIRIKKWKKFKQLP